MSIGAVQETMRKIRMKDSQSGGRKRVEEAIKRNRNRIVIMKITRNAKGRERVGMRRER